MRAQVFAALFLFSAAGAVAGESVTVPWDEFKRLYGESVRREVMQGLPVKAAAAAVTIEEAVYRLKVEGGSASGHVLLTGKAQAGRVEPLRLFGDDVVIAAVESVKGAALVAAAGGGVAVLPAEKSEFQVELSILLPVRADERSKLVSFRAPAALRNSLAVELPERMQLVAAPGLAGRDGVRHFAGAEAVEIRFAAERAAAAPAPAPPPLEIDVLTRVAVQERRVTLESCLAPARPVAGPVVVKLPEGARYVGASLQAAWVEKSGEGALKLNLPAGFAEAFVIQCAIERAAGDGETALALPGIEGNTGREGFLALDEPDDAEVKLSGEGLTAGLAAARLPATLRAAAVLRDGLMRAAPGGRLTLSVRRFQAVKAPEMILDAIHFYAAFEENGGVLSVLRVKLPASAGPRLTLKRVAGAEIWSLKVNGEKKEVYSLDQESWIVPLAAGRESEVELAFLRRGPKLALQGRLDALLPETGLSARKLHVGVALPARVDLLSVEGDLSPAEDSERAAPAEFAGRRYYFSRAFYKGEALKAALYYKEPVEQDKGRRQ